MANPAIYAMEVLQKAMQGEAENAGLTTEDNIISLCLEARAEVDRDKLFPPMVDTTIWKFDREEANLRGEEIICSFIGMATR